MSVLPQEWRVASTYRRKGNSAQRSRREHHFLSSAPPSLPSSFPSSPLPPTSPQATARRSQPPFPRHWPPSYKMRMDLRLSDTLPPSSAHSAPPSLPPSLPTYARFCPFPPTPFLISFALFTSPVLRGAWKRRTCGKEGGRNGKRNELGKIKKKE